jgi:DNA-directed RNA polymerase specialized sigma24 family protein
MELHSSNPLNSYCNSCTEDILSRFDPYIIDQVKKLAVHNISWIHRDLLSLEIDEVTQLVRIKFWRALQKQEIQHPLAYIQRIIRNELIDMGRRRKPDLPLEEENGEVICGKVMVIPSEGMNDPASEFEQKVAIAENMDLVAEAVSTLPPRQKLSMVCYLLERVDEDIQLVEALKTHQVEVDVTQWPENQDDAQRLKASITFARQKIAKRWYINTSDCTRRGVSHTPLSCTEKFGT